MWQHTLNQDARGLAGGIISFIAIIVISALLYTMLNMPMDQVFADMSTYATSSQSADAIDLRQQIFTNILFYPLLLGLVFLIARAVFESRVGP